MSNTYKAKRTLILEETQEVIFIKDNLYNEIYENPFEKNDTVLIDEQGDYHTIGKEYREENFELYS